MDCGNQQGTFKKLKTSKDNNKYPVTFNEFKKYTNVEEYIVKEMQCAGPEIYNKHFHIRHRYYVAAYKNFYTNDILRNKLLRSGLVVKPMPFLYKKKLMSMPGGEPKGPPMVEPIPMEKPLVTDMKNILKAFEPKRKFESHTFRNYAHVKRFKNSCPIDREGTEITVLKKNEKINKKVQRILGTISSDSDDSVVESERNHSAYVLNCKEAERRKGFTMLPSCPSKKKQTLKAQEGLDSPIVEKNSISESMSMPPLRVDSTEWRQTQISEVGERNSGDSLSISVDILKPKDEPLIEETNCLPNYDYVEGGMEDIFRDSESEMEIPNFQTFLPKQGEVSKNVTKSVSFQKTEDLKTSPLSSQDFDTRSSNLFQSSGDKTIVDVSELSIPDSSVDEDNGLHFDHDVSELSSSVEIIEPSPAEPILVDDEETTPELFDMMLRRPSKIAIRKLLLPPVDVIRKHVPYSFSPAQQLSSDFSFTSIPSAGFRFDLTESSIVESEVLEDNVSKEKRTERDQIPSKETFHGSYIEQSEAPMSHGHSLVKGSETFGNQSFQTSSAQATIMPTQVFEDNNRASSSATKRCKISLSPFTRVKPTMKLTEDDNKSQTDKSFQSSLKKSEVTNVDLSNLTRGCHEVSTFKNKLKSVRLNRDEYRRHLPAYSASKICSDSCSSDLESPNELAIDQEKFLPSTPVEGTNAQRKPFNIGDLKTNKLSSVRISRDEYQRHLPANSVSKICSDSCSSDLESPNELVIDQEKFLPSTPVEGTNAQRKLINIGDLKTNKLRSVRISRDEYQRHLPANSVSKICSDSCSSDLESPNELVIDQEKFLPSTPVEGTNAQRKLINIGDLKTNKLSSVRISRDEYQRHLPANSVSKICSDSCSSDLESPNELVIDQEKFLPSSPVEGTNAQRKLINIGDLKTNKLRSVRISRDEYRRHLPANSVSKICSDSCSSDLESPNELEIDQEKFLPSSPVEGTNAQRKLINIGDLKTNKLSNVRISRDEYQRHLPANSVSKICSDSCSSDLESPNELAITQENVAPSTEGTNAQRKPFNIGDLKTNKLSNVRISRDEYRRHLPANSVSKICSDSCSSDLESPNELAIDQEKFLPSSPVEGTNAQRKLINIGDLKTNKLSNVRISRDEYRRHLPANSVSKICSHSCSSVLESPNELVIDQEKFLPSSPVEGTNAQRKLINIGDLKTNKLSNVRISRDEYRRHLPANSVSKICSDSCSSVLESPNELVIDQEKFLPSSPVEGTNAQRKLINIGDLKTNKLSNVRISRDEYQRHLPANSVSKICSDSCSSDLESPNELVIDQEKFLPSSPVEGTNAQRKLINIGDLKTNKLSNVRISRDEYRSHLPANSVSKICSDSCSSDLESPNELAIDQEKFLPSTPVEGTNAQRKLINIGDLKTNKLSNVRISRDEYRRHLPANSVSKICSDSCSSDLESPNELAIDQEKFLPSTPVEGTNAQRKPFNIGDLKTNKLSNVRISRDEYQRHLPANSAFKKCSDSCSSDLESPNELAIDQEKFLPSTPVEGTNAQRKLINIGDLKTNKLSNVRISRDEYRRHLPANSVSKICSDSCSSDLESPNELAIDQEKFLPSTPVEGINAQRKLINIGDLKTNKLSNVRISRDEYRRHLPANSVSKICSDSCSSDLESPNELAIDQEKFLPSTPVEGTNAQRKLINIGDLKTNKLSNVRISRDEYRRHLPANSVSKICSDSCSSDLESPNELAITQENVAPSTERTNAQRKPFNIGDLKINNLRNVRISRDEYRRHLPANSVSKICSDSCSSDLESPNELAITQENVAPSTEGKPFYIGDLKTNKLRNVRISRDEYRRHLPANSVSKICSDSCSSDLESPNELAIDQEKFLPSTPVEGTNAQRKLINIGDLKTNKLSNVRISRDEYRRHLPANSVSKICSDSCSSDLESPNELVIDQENLLPSTPVEGTNAQRKLINIGDLKTNKLSNVRISRDEYRRHLPANSVSKICSDSCSSDLESPNELVIDQEKFLPSTPVEGTNAQRKLINIGDLKTNKLRSVRISRDEYQRHLPANSVSKICSDSCSSDLESRNELAIDQEKFLPSTPVEGTNAQRKLINIGDLKTNKLSNVRISRDEYRRHLPANSVSKICSHSCSSVLESPNELVIDQEKFLPSSPVEGTNAQRKLINIGDLKTNKLSNVRISRDEYQRHLPANSVSKICSDSCSSDLESPNELAITQENVAPSTEGKPFYIGDLKTKKLRNVRISRDEYQRHLPANSFSKICSDSCSSDLESPNELAITQENVAPSTEGKPFYIGDLKTNTLRSVRISRDEYQRHLPTSFSSDQEPLTNTLVNVSPSTEATSESSRKSFTINPLTPQQPKGATDGVILNISPINAPTDDQKTNTETVNVDAAFVCDLTQSDVGTRSSNTKNKLLISIEFEPPAITDKIESHKCAEYFFNVKFKVKMIENKITIHEPESIKVEGIPDKSGHDPKNSTANVSKEHQNSTLPHHTTVSFPIIEATTMNKPTSTVDVGTNTDQFPLTAVPIASNSPTLSSPSRKEHSEQEATQPDFTASPASKVPKIKKANKTPKPDFVPQAVEKRTTTNDNKIYVLDDFVEDTAQLIPASQILGLDCSFFESSQLERIIDKYSSPRQAATLQKQTLSRANHSAFDLNRSTILSDGITYRKVWKVHLECKTPTKMTIETRFLINRHWLSAYGESAKLMFNFSPSTWSNVHRVMREIHHFEYRRMAVKEKKHCPVVTPLHKVLRILFDSAPQVVNVKLIDDIDNPFVGCEKVTPQYRKPFQSLTKGIPANILSRMKALKEQLCKTKEEGN